MTIDISTIKSQFPALDQQVNGQRLIYLDSAATSLKPKAVIDRLAKYYAQESANVHRGAHFLANQGTANFEAARNKVAKFLGVEDSATIIFTSGTTESVNLVADSYVRRFLQPGDEILISDIEHHANIVPWQLACKRFDVVLRVVKATRQGVIEPDAVDAAMSARTKLVALTHASNTLGVIQPMDQISKVVRKNGAHLLVDGAQYVAYGSVNLAELDADFYAFSAHKVFGPTGIGVLYARRELLDEMGPYQSGGSMIDRVDLDEGTTFNDIPHRFEAGTPHIAGVIGLGAALDFFQSLDQKQLFEHEKSLREKCITGLESIGDISIYSKDEKTVPIVSFNLDGVHHSDVGSLLDQMGVAVRVGHHCTQPLMKKMGISGTVRASLSIFNDEQDMKDLVNAVAKAKEMLL